MFHLIVLVLVLLALVAVALLARARRRPLATSVTDISAPRFEADRPTLVPGGDAVGDDTRSMRVPRRLDEASAAARPKLPPGMHGTMVLSIVVIASMGCASTSAGSAAAATGEALSVVREVRERVCDPAVDLLVGPLQSRPCRCDRPASSGGSTSPSTPVPNAPPAAPSAPAAPSTTPAPTVAPTPPQTPPAGPAKGGVRRS